MNGHTPGQWRLADDWQQSGVILANDEVRLPIGTVATLIGFSSRSLAELEANGRLIAAAPELLEALKEIVAIADRQTVEFDRARAAIAKAEGAYSCTRKPGEQQLPSITARQSISSGYPHRKADIQP